MPVTTVVVCCSSSVTISYAWRTSCARNISLKNKSEVLSLIWEADEAGARLCVYVGVRVRVCVVDVSHKTRKKKTPLLRLEKQYYILIYVHVNMPVCIYHGGEESWRAGWEIRTCK
jgi:hypothetical protein